MNARQGLHGRSKRGEIPISKSLSVVVCRLKPNLPVKRHTSKIFHYTQLKVRHCLTNCAIPPVCRQAVPDLQFIDLQQPMENRLEFGLEFESNSMTWIGGFSFGCKGIHD